MRKVLLVDGRIAPDLDHDLVRIELPLGTGQFAGGDGSIVDDVVIGTGLFHDLAGKSEGVGRRQDHPLTVHPQARRSLHMFKTSSFSPHVVGAMSGFDVLIIRAAIENDVAIRRGVAGLGVVVDRIGIEDVGAVVNFRLAAQFEYGPVFFLLQGANGDVLRIHRGRRRRKRRVGETKTWR